MSIYQLDNFIKNEATGVYVIYQDITVFPVNLSIAWASKEKMMSLNGVYKEPDSNMNKNENYSKNNEVTRGINNEVRK